LECCAEYTEFIRNHPKYQELMHKLSTLTFTDMFRKVFMMAQQYYQEVVRQLMDTLDRATSQQEVRQIRDWALQKIYEVCFVN